ncbi:hypothetical protein ACFLXU_07740 [Chloroflexota bacterium]
MNSQYEVLSPWAEVDPKPLRGISPRLTDLKDKTIGLFINPKTKAPQMLAAVEAGLKERYPTLQFSRFSQRANREIIGSDQEAAFNEWIKGVDAVVTGAGD